jgi:hypothetical protein
VAPDLLLTAGPLELKQAGCPAGHPAFFVPQKPKPIPPLNPNNQRRACRSTPHPRINTALQI